MKEDQTTEEVGRRKLASCSHTHTVILSILLASSSSLSNEEMVESAIKLKKQPTLKRSKKPDRVS